MTLQQFNIEVCNFRKAMGNTKYWQPNGQPTPLLDRLYHVLGSCYLNVPTADTETAALTFQATSSEYLARERLMVTKRFQQIV